jgi:hypothetical protein
MVARYRCAGGQLSAGRIRLTDEIKRGIQVFEGAIVIDPDARLPITIDREHYSFFSAIVNGCNEALPEIEPRELAAWRDYVLNGGPVPKWRKPVVFDASHVSQRAAVENCSVIASLLHAVQWLHRSRRRRAGTS